MSTSGMSLIAPGHPRKPNAAFPVHFVLSRLTPGGHMSKLLLSAALLLPLLALRPAAAQQPQGTITGRVVTESTGAPLSSATVQIRRMEDSSLVAGVITNASGAFLRDGLAYGRYRVEISSIGHASVSRTDVVFSAAAARVDLGTVGLPLAALELEEVRVDAERSQVVLAPDRSIYNVREMPVAQGGMATDALRAIPELEVDVDDKITARGATPQIHLDGRPLPMQGEAQIAFLRTLRADRIDRIEYIPNPSARFEAEGQSGIVNIVLRSDVGLGFSGSGSANVGTRGTQNVSTRLNYQRGRLTFFGGGLLGYNQNRSRTFDFRENRAVTPVTYLQQTRDYRGNGMNAGADLTTELKLSERITVWSILRGNMRDANEEWFSEFLHLDAGQTPWDWYERKRHSDTRTHNFSTAIGFRRVVESQRDEFSAEIRYGRNGRDLGTRNWRFPFTPEGEPIAVDPDLTGISAISQGDTWAIQMDLMRPLSSATRFDIGYRGNFRINQNRQDVDYFVAGVPSQDRDENGLFHYDEDSNAAYVNVDNRLGSLGIQAGLRLEQVTGYNTSSLLAAPLRATESGLFPSANVAYDFGSGRQLRLSYSRRIQRPSAGDYDPINSTPADPFNRRTGNPLLTPAKLHNGSVDASWTGNVGTLRASQFIMQGSGFWLLTQNVDKAGVLTMMPENVAAATVLGTNLNASVRQVGPLSGFANLGIQRIDFDAGSANLNSRALLMWFSNLNVTANLPSDVRLQLTGRYSPAQATPDGRRSSFKQANIALTKRMWQNRSVVSLSIVDPFELSRNTFMTQNASVENTSRTTNRIRRATLTFTYNFGRAPQSSRRVVEEGSSGGGGLGL